MKRIESGGLLVVVQEAVGSNPFSHPIFSTASNFRMAPGPVSWVAGGPPGGHRDSRIGGNRTTVRS